MDSIISFIAVVTTDNSSTEPWVVILLAIISTAGIAITGWFSYMAQKHAKKGVEQATIVNDAVNHRKPGQDRLFDMVASTRDSVNDISEWKEKWEITAGKYAEPQAILTSFAVLEDRMTTLGERLDINIIKLRDHIDEKVGVLDDRFTKVEEKLSTHISDSAQTKDLIAELDRKVNNKGTNKNV
jgi:hypothetical protein